MRGNEERDGNYSANRYMDGDGRGGGKGHSLDEPISHEFRSGCGFAGTQSGGGGLPLELYLWRRR